MTQRYRTGPNGTDRELDEGLRLQQLPPTPTSDLLQSVLLAGFAVCVCVFVCVCVCVLAWRHNIIPPG
jgi:ABC-type Fe3+ transport system permease subunit